MSLRAEREQEAAARRRSRWRLGTAAGAVLAAVAGLLVLAGGRPVPPGRSAYDAGTTDPVAAAAPVLAGYAEQARGILFTRPPTFEVAAAAVLAATVPAEPAGRAATRAALGLPRAVAPGPVVRYDPARKAVLIRAGTPIDAYARVLIVRELTRALQDQNFGLGVPAATAQDADRVRARSALVEGDAIRIALGYLATLPAAEQAGLRARLLPAAPLEQAFTGAVGAEFVTALAREGGNAAVDAAFARPPSSTAQVIDPARYTGGAEPLGVRAPAGEGQRLDAGTLGQYGLAALITGGKRVLNAGAAGRWLGDSYGTFRSAAGVCTYGNVVVADTEAREQLLRDLARWAAGRATVTRSADRGVRFRTCV
jgi:hypothetical protein